MTAVRASLWPATPDTPASLYKRDYKLPTLAIGSNALSPSRYTLSGNPQVNRLASHTTSGPVASRKRPAEDTTRSSEGAASREAGQQGYGSVTAGTISTPST